MKENSAEIISRLKSEIEDLRRENQQLLQQIEKDTFKDKIREILKFIDIITVVSSTKEDNVSLKNLLTLASSMVNAEASSILLYDEKADNLYFEEAIGEKSEELKQFTVKPNEGIAGYCFTTGETLAVSDVMQDPRFKKEIAEKLQLKQKALLAAPLIYRQDVIGVMEAVNKRDGGTFSGQDVEMFSVLANFAASFIYKNNARADLYTLFLSILKNAASDEKLADISIGKVFEVTKNVEQELLTSEDYSRSVELASLVEEVSASGSLEFDFVRSILLRFRQYLKDQGHYDVHSVMEWN
jgi:signal transduction protein with GAF and PtsI domain